MTENFTHEDICAGDRYNNGSGEIGTFTEVIPHADGLEIHWVHDSEPGYVYGIGSRFPREMSLSGVTLLRFVIEEEADVFD